MKQDVQGRLIWGDLCRVLAIYGVILIHSCGAFFYQFGKISEVGWLSANFLDSLVRCSVPLFVMLSGALLLKQKNEVVTISDILKRTNKVLLPLVFWSIFYLLLLSHHSGEEVQWGSVFQKPAMYHLWFVYMIVGIYLLLPIMQVVFQLLMQRDDLKLYFLALWLLVTCVPTYFKMPILSLVQQEHLFGYGGYFIIGGIIARSSRDRVPTAVWSIIFALGVMFTFLYTWYLSSKAGVAVEAAYVYFTPNVVIASIAAFVLFSRIEVPPVLAKGMEWVGERSFIIFFVHVVALEYVRYSKLIALVTPHLPTLFVILLISILTFLLSLLVAAVLRLIPGVSRVVG